MQHCIKTTVQQVLSGNTDAYNHIVSHYKNAIFNTIFAIVKNYHTANDLTQDTFIEGYIKLSTLEDPEKISSWLTRIAKNKCYNYITRSAIKYEGQLHDYIPDTRVASPENLLIAQHEQHMVTRAISNLPDAQKIVTELYYFADLPQAEIAQLLQIPLGTVGRRLYDARAKLKKEMLYMNNDTKVSKDLERQVAEKVKFIRNYHTNHNTYDGMEPEFKKAVKLIDKLPNSTNKHNAYAEVYHIASNIDTTHVDRALQEALLGDNEIMLSKAVTSKLLADYSNDFIAGTDEILPKIMDIPKDNSTDNVIGEVLFWRAVQKFRNGQRVKNMATLKDAKADFIEAEKLLHKTSAYAANAIAGVKAVDTEANDTDKYVNSAYAICGEFHMYNNGKVTAGSQPGFSDNPWWGINIYNSINYYASWPIDQNFFDENEKIGETTTGKEGGTRTLVAKNETVTVQAGTFENCMHLRLNGITKWANYYADIYYAKGIGLVKANFSDGERVENYELCQYKINEGSVGSEYFPFAVGNMWRYVNTNLSPIYWQFSEREITNVCTYEDMQATSPEAEDLEKNWADGIYATFSALDYIRMKKPQAFSNEYTADEYITIAQTLAHQDTSPTNLDDAKKCLEFAQKSGSEKATQFAKSAHDFVNRFIDRFIEHKNKTHRFLPSSIACSILATSAESITYGESADGYHFGVAPLGTRHAENKIFGMKPFRYLQILAGTLFNKKWAAGYSESTPHESGTLYTQVENAGTVTVKAGTFENCLKITFRLENENIAHPHYYFHHPEICTFKYTHYGTKVYYFAPGVGIVKHDCTWGESLSSVCELTEYKIAVTNRDYMPVSIGNCWVYEETTLEGGYLAQRTYDIVSAAKPDDEFFMVEQQEFVYTGTEKEYSKLHL